MGLSKLTSIAVMAAFLAASNGQLPRMIKAVKIAQVKLNGFSGLEMAQGDALTNSVNARAKDVRIGRLKTRDSDLIRKLRASGITYRQIAMISKCSTGAVSAELKAMKAEKAKSQVIEALPTK